MDSDWICYGSAETCGTCKHIDPLILMFSTFQTLYPLVALVRSTTCYNQASLLLQANVIVIKVAKYNSFDLVEASQLNKQGLSFSCSTTSAQHKSGDIELRQRGGTKS